MGKVACKAVKNHEVPRRGKPSIEFHKDGVPQYYCCGWVNEMTDEVLETCWNCRDYVDRAQDDLDEWNQRKGVE